MLRTLMFSVALVGATSAQDALVVDANGGGDFTNVIDAVAAALDGDVLLIASGDYTLDGALGSGGPIVAGKSLTLIGEGPTRPMLAATSVVGVGAGQSVVLRNLELLGDVADAPGLHVSASAGTVWVEDCRITGAVGAGLAVLPETIPGAPGLEVDGANVFVSDSRITGGQGADGQSFLGTTIFATDGGAGILATDANVSVWDSLVSGGRGGDFLSGPASVAANGDAGLRAGGSTRVFLSGVNVVGGRGGNFCLPGAADSFCIGGDGVDVSSPAIVQWIDSPVGGGAGGILNDGSAGQAGVAVLAPDGGADDLIGVARSLDVTTPVREFDSGVVTYAGEPGDVVGLFWSPGGGYAALPGKQGVFALAFGLVTTIPIGAAPSGELTLPFVAPDLGTLGIDGATVYLQAFAQTSGGDLRLTSATSLTIVDGAL